MLLILFVSLYTSRIVLNTLGVEDFGIYNVVGGFVAMFGFLNNAMTSTTQRFFSFEIGKGDKIQLNNVFNMSINVHILIALLILIFAETFGLWFLNNQLIIPIDRLVAANLVYQFSILTLLVNILSVPYNAIIIAEEHMSVFAVVSVVEVSLKLLLVFILQWYGLDKLVLYSILIFSISIIIRVIYGIYCRSKFQESKFKFYWNTSLFKQMLNYVSWMLFSTSAEMLSAQGLNMLMNVFFGVTVNAARAISYQIQAAVHSFVVNFMIAVRPQIIKKYAKNEFSEMFNLVFSASKFSFFLLFYISLPVLILTKTVLLWWLKIVPDYTVIFTKLIIIDLFFTVLFTSLTTVSQATGKIKIYQIAVSISFIVVFILSYLFFNLGYPSYFAFVIMIAVSIVSLYIRLVVLKKLINFPVKDYVKKVLFRIFFVVLLSIPIPLIVYSIVDDYIIQFIFVTVTSIFCITLAIMIVGVNREEKLFLKNKLLLVKNNFLRRI